MIEQIFRNIPQGIDRLESFLESHHVIPSDALLSRGYVRLFLSIEPTLY